MQENVMQPSVKTHYTSIRLIRSRGWTYELIEELLPPCERRTDGNNGIEYFPKAVVQEKEKTSAFRDKCRLTRDPQTGKAIKFVQPKVKTHFTKTKLIHSRGWTDELIKELLPPAVKRTDIKKSEEYYPKEAVLEAEKTSAFQKKRRLERDSKPEAVKKPVQPKAKTHFTNIAVKPPDLSVGI